jgi:transposase InsO family protein
VAPQGIPGLLAVEVTRCRPPLPKDIRQLIARMVRENVTWGEERVANELSLKLGILVSPRTVRKYWPRGESNDAGGRRTSSQDWKTFVKNHAQGIVACDFLVAVTARFRVLFVFVAMELGSRRILHCNVTAHPTASWTLQQLREAIPSDHSYRFLIHDRDSIFSSDLDEELRDTFGLRVIRTPIRAPQANAYCERLIGTVRRECLDFLIPLNENTCGEAWGLGSLTIIEDGHTRAWARESPSRRLIDPFLDDSHRGIDCRATARSE